MVGMLLLAAGVQAQPADRRGSRDRLNDRGDAGARNGGRRADRIEAIKIGYLSERLQLSTPQAEAFWPVYHAYERELREAQAAFRRKYGGSANLKSDAEAGRFIEDKLDFQEQTIRIRRAYKERFLKTISATQLASLYEAERDFRELLLKRLRDRRDRN